RIFCVRGDTVQYRIESIPSGTLAGVVAINSRRVLLDGPLNATGCGCHISLLLLLVAPSCPQGALAAWTVLFRCHQPAQFGHHDKRRDPLRAVPAEVSILPSDNRGVLLWFVPPQAVANRSEKHRYRALAQQL